MGHKLLQRRRKKKKGIKEICLFKKKNYPLKIRDIILYESLKSYYDEKSIKYKIYHAIIYCNTALLLLKLGDKNN